MLRLRAHPPRLGALLLAATLVFAQWSLLEHQLTAEPHVSDHACEWCLTHGHLADAAPAAAVIPFAPALDRRPAPAPVAEIPAVGATGYRSRAPPVFSA
jgi:hypothetical protein